MCDVVPTVAVFQQDLLCVLPGLGRRCFDGGRHFAQFYRVSHQFYLAQGGMLHSGKEVVGPCLLILSYICRVLYGRID